MNGDGFGVGRLSLNRTAPNMASLRKFIGWYDSVFDEELGSQPCIFTSVTPVSAIVGGFSSTTYSHLPGLE